MNNCIFCKIIKKEVPADIVHEDKDFIVFLSIDPRSPGHSLIVPKNHHRWVWDVPNCGEYFEVARKIALAQRKAFGTEEIWSKVIGEEVPHAHIWIFPKPGTTGDPKDFKTNRDKIVSML